MICIDFIDFQLNIDFQGFYHFHGPRRRKTTFLLADPMRRCLAMAWFLQPNCPRLGILEMVTGRRKNNTWTVKRSIWQIVNETTRLLFKHPMRVADRTRNANRSAPEGKLDQFFPYPDPSTLFSPHLPTASCPPHHSPHLSSDGNSRIIMQWGMRTATLTYEECAHAGHQISHESTTHEQCPAFFAQPRWDP